MAYLMRIIFRRCCLQQWLPEIMGQIVRAVEGVDVDEAEVGVYYVFVRGRTQKQNPNTVSKSNCSKNWLQKKH